MYYCARCNSIMEPMAYAALAKSDFTMSDTGMVRCPTKGCDSAIVDIDEIFIPLVHELYELGLRTMYCCSGHGYELCEHNHTYIYFVYDHDFDLSGMCFVYDFTEELIRMSKEEEYSFLEVKITNEKDVRGENRPYFDIEGSFQETTRTVHVNAKSLDIPEDTLPLIKHAILLERQAQFIGAMHDAICRVFAKMKSAEEEDTKTMEENTKE